MPDMRRGQGDRIVPAVTLEIGDGWPLVGMSDLFQGKEEEATVIETSPAFRVVTITFAMVLVLAGVVVRFLMSIAARKVAEADRKPRVVITVYDRPDIVGGVEIEVNTFGLPVDSGEGATAQKISQWMLQRFDERMAEEKKNKSEMVN